MSKKIVIIGGVAAGMSAAAKAKRLDKNLNITVYEKTDIVSWGACGMPYYVGDFYDDPEIMVARDINQFKKDGINVHSLHEVIDIEPKTQTLRVKDIKNNKIISDTYDELIIATGASAIIPPIENINSENIFSLKEFKDGIKLKKAIQDKNKKNVVIIGAGYIGIEAVEACLKMEKNVVLIQKGDRVLDKSFDEEITSIMENELNNTKNLKLKLNEEVLKFEEENGILTKVITDKDEYLADIVIMAIGVRPNTNFLKDKGIEMLKNGALIINGFGQTSYKNIYAAGDCASVYHKVRRENVYIPLATTSNKIGRVLGEHLAGKDITFLGTLGSAAIKVLDLEAGRTGITENEAKELGIPYVSVFIEDVNQTGYYPGQEILYGKLIVNSISREVLGGQLIGKKGAVLRVDILAAAIDKHMTVDEMSMLDLCYAPPFSTTWDIINNLASVAKSRLKK